VGPRAVLNTAVAKRKKSHPCPRRELNPGCSARSLVSTLTEIFLFIRVGSENKLATLAITSVRLLTIQFSNLFSEWTEYFTIRVMILTS